MNVRRSVELGAALALGAALVSLVGWLYSDIEQKVYQWRAIYYYHRDIGDFHGKMPTMPR